MAAHEARASGVLTAATRRAPDPGDTLSDVLEAVRLTGALFFLVDASKPWIAEAPTASELAPVILPSAQHVVSYHVIRSGSCWCESPGQAPLRLESGDVLIVPHGHTYSLTSERGLRTGGSSAEALEWFRAMAEGRLPFVVSEGGGGPDKLGVVCGFLGCDTLPFNPALSMLPALVRVRAGGSSDRLDALLDFAVAESTAGGPGSRSVRLRIAELVFVEVLRGYLMTASDADTSWLGGLRHPIVGRALACLHARPAHAWTLPELSREVGASRSVLVERFTAFVGIPPMLYLTHWRMQLAANRLATGAAAVGAIGHLVGYESEAAFCRAFKKVTGVTPASWRSRRRATP